MNAPALAALTLSLLARPPVAAQLDRGLTLHAAGPQRAVWATGRLVGSPYLLAPLGDESGPERGPRFRLDGFDCMTFVETAIALANSESVAAAAKLMDDIRYHGPPDYAHRNHYVEAQWIPANLRKGWIADATGAIAGALAESAEKNYAPVVWKRAERSRFRYPHLPADRRPDGLVSIPIVPVDRVAEIADRIPDGTILLLVRADRPWRPYRVSHMGLVVMGPGGERRVRHASDLRTSRRVLEDPIDRFIADARVRHRSWPVAGVSFYAIRENLERARELVR